MKVRHVEVTRLEAKMKLLVSLQDCDTRIIELEKTIERAPVKIHNLAEALNAFENQLQEELELLDNFKRERRGIEQDLLALESRIEKSQVKLSNIKSNKEYRAALKEIDDLNTEKSSQEDKVLDNMEKIEDLELKSREKKARVEKMKKQFEKDKEEILKEQKTLELELEGLQKERIKICQALDQKLLKRYDFLKERKAGIAVSPVVNGVCQTCHMGIPPQKFNELIRGDVLLNCPNCMRIIYWGGNEKLQGAVQSP